MSRRGFILVALIVLLVAIMFLATDLIQNQRKALSRSGCCAN